MFTQKNITKSVLRIDDTSLSYVTLAKNEYGFFVDQHETVQIPEGIISGGEILKADILYKLLKKIAPVIVNKNIDIVLPHGYFLCADGTLEPAPKTPLKKRVQEYFKNTNNSEPWHKTHVCEFSTHIIQGKEKVLFKCLPKDIQNSYTHIAKRAGFKIVSISSDILAFDHLVYSERTSLIHVSAETTRVAEFKAGMYISHKTFQVSYDQFIRDIEKVLSINSSDARVILDKYGLLRAHRDEKVYTRLLRSMSPLTDFLSKRKTKDPLSIKVVFDQKPIPGFIDHLLKILRTETSELDILRTHNYVFQDILSLHRDESYQYQSAIAQALKFWKE